MANPRKPTALKMIQGSARINRDRLNPNEPVPTKDIGPAPEYLTDDQRAIWNEIVGQMYEGVLGEADRTALELMVRLVHMTRTNFEAMTAAHLTRLNGLLSQFGMTPADRTRISVPKPRDAGNPFDGM